jgi:hypothetical protein
MTYFAKSRLTRPSLSARAIQMLVQRLGEPFRFGWVPGQLPEYLRVRGFALERDLATSEAARALMPPELAAHVASADSRVAFARVKA